MFKPPTDETCDTRKWLEAVTVLSERDESISLARAIGDDAAPKQGRQLGMSAETDGVRFTEQDTNRPVKFSYCLLIAKF